MKVIVELSEGLYNSAAEAMKKEYIPVYRAIQLIKAVSEGIIIPEGAPYRIGDIYYDEFTDVGKAQTAVIGDELMEHYKKLAEHYDNKFKKEKGNE